MTSKNRNHKLREHILDEHFKVAQNELRNAYDSFYTFKGVEVTRSFLKKTLTQIYKIEAHLKKIKPKEKTCP